MNKKTDMAEAPGMGNITAPCGGLRPIGRCACAEGVRLADERSEELCEEKSQRPRAARLRWPVVQNVVPSRMNSGRLRWMMPLRCWMGSLRVRMYLG